MRHRLKRALIGYAALSLMAVLTLEGKYLAFILILMGALAVKSWVAAKGDQ